MNEQEYLKVTVKAGAKADSVIVKNGRFHVSCKAKALDGKANSAVTSLLASYLKIREKSLSLIRGSDRPSKIFIKRY